MYQVCALVTFPSSQIVNCGEVSLEVFEAGEGGMPLVLAHGWPEHAYSWRYQIPALVEQGYHVIVPNQRGYGRSDKPEDVASYNCLHLCGDLNGLLDALGIEKATFIGHDWGAILVWHHVLLNPDRVLGVANLSVPFRPREPSDPVAFWEEQLGSNFYIVHFNRFPGVAAEAFEQNPRRFLRNMFRTKQWLDQSQPLPDGSQIINYANTDVVAGECHMTEEELDVFVESFEQGGFHAPINWYCNFTRNWELTADVEQKVRRPALMVYGKYDLVPQTDMTEYADDLETHTLECGHWIQQEQPDATNEILIEWLNRKMKPLY